jgi:hypothetical protein
MNLFGAMQWSVYAALGCKANMPSSPVNMSNTLGFALREELRVRQQQKNGFNGKRTEWHFYAHKK